MMCYRDRTWCPAKHCNNFDKCDRALTDAVRAKAKMWWGGENAPIAVFSEPEKLECFEKEDDIVIDPD